MNNFIHLHVHSDGSLQDGIQTVDQIAKKAAEFEMPAVALTDHGRASNILKFKKACEKVNIKPILGIELYVAPTDRTLKQKIDGHSKTAYHLTVLAKNHEGLKNIFRLTSRSWITGQYPQGKPRVDNQLIQECSEGLIILSGCGSGRLSTYLLENRWEEAREHTDWMRSIFKDDFYIELQNHGLEWQPELNNRLKIIASEFNIPTVITQDSHYINREDSDLHQNICKIVTGGGITFDSDQSYFKSRSEMEAMFDQSDWHALDRTLEIADKCNVEWDYSKTIWPVYDLPKDITAEDELRRLTHKGFIDRFGAGTKEYIDRLEYELKVIIKMGFPNYFLIVQDFVNWCKNNNILVSPGRGSAAGSLVCYCLGITQVDPIKYNLLFNRFLNESRISLPDIDYDCPKDKRNQLLSYVSNKYGLDKIAQIGTYAEMKPRGSLRSFARVNGYPVSVGDQLAKMVPPAIAGKDFKWKTILEKQPEFLQTGYPEVVNLSIKAEGIKFQAGIHAAGVVLSDKPIEEIVPLFTGKHGEIATQFDMHDVEEIGLVKFDFLGLKTLTVIADTLELIKDPIDIYSLEDGDKETYELFKNGNVEGIFQFETSGGFKELAMQIKPTCIDDLSTITALFRPGPLEAKITENYVKRRNGESFEYDIKELEPILSTTYGNIVFQEQIMRVCVAIAGYTEPEADNMRKIVGKKIVDKMIKEKDKFVSGCVKNNIEEDKAIKLFENIEGFAKYGFNACLPESETILLSSGKTITIKELKEKLKKGTVYLKSFDTKSKTVIEDECINIIDSGEQEVFEITLSNNSTFECTLDHKFLCTDNKMHKVKEIIKYGLDILSCDNILKILSLKPKGKKQVYNLTMRGENHNYLLSNNLVSANSHSIAYSFMSYWCAWLKAHYPKEFYTSLLNNSLKDQDDIIKYIHSAREMEIPLAAPSVNRSIDKFILDSGTIIFGLSGLKGIGMKSCEQFLAARPETGFETLLDLLEAGIDKKTITALAECGALEEITDLRRWQIIENVGSFIETIKKIKTWEEGKRKFDENEQAIKKAVERGEKPPRRMPKRKPKPTLPEIEPGEPESRKNRLHLERKTLGFYLTGHPLDDYPKLTTTNKLNISKIKAGDISDKQIVKIPVVISDITEKCSKKKVNYGIIIIEDQTGRIESTLFSKTWEEYKNKIKEEDIVILEGRVNIIEQDDAPPIVKILTNKILTIDTDNNKTSEPINISLSDCSILIIPSENTDTNKWTLLKNYLKESRLLNG